MSLLFLCAGTCALFLIVQNGYFRSFPHSANRAQVFRLHLGRVFHATLLIHFALFNEATVVIVRACRSIAKLITTHGFLSPSTTHRCRTFASHTHSIIGHARYLGNYGVNCECYIQCWSVYGSLRALNPRPCRQRIHYIDTTR